MGRNMCTVALTTIAVLLLAPFHTAQAAVTGAVGSSAIEDFMTACVGEAVLGFTYEASGSGAGVDEANAGGVGVSDVAPGLGAGFTECPAVSGSIGVIVNGITGLQLDPCTLVGIYTCTITQFDDPAIQALNPGMSLSGTIIPIARQDSSGSTELFTAYAATCPSASLGAPAKLVDWAPCVERLPGTSGVLEEMGVAFGHMGYASKDGGFPEVALEDDHGHFHTSEDSHAPMQFTAVIVAKDNVKGLKKFLNAVHKEGTQECAKQNGFTGLSEEQRASC